MIPMLRRRLMSNMAKAKNIATGEATVATISDSPRRAVLKVSGLGFTPNHVACVHIGAGRGPILGIWDGTGYNSAITINLSLSFDTDGFELAQVLDSPAQNLSGTYKYVTWQE